MRLIIALLKYTPFVLILLMVLHCAMLLVGIDDTLLSHSNLSVLPFVLYMALSYKLGFCRWHRYALIYNFAVYILIVLRESGVIVDSLQIVRLCVMVVGVILLSMYLIVRRYERC